MATALGDVVEDEAITAAGAAELGTRSSGGEDGYSLARSDLGIADRAEADPLQRRRGVAPLVFLALGRVQDDAVPTIVRAVSLAPNGVDRAAYELTRFTGERLRRGTEGPGGVVVASEPIFASLLGKRIAVHREGALAPGPVRLAIAHLEGTAVFFAAHGSAEVARFIVPHTTGHQANAEKSNG